MTNSPELREQIEDNENGSCKIGHTLPTGEDMYDSRILQDVLVSDRATVELIVQEQSYTKTSLGDAQDSSKSEQKILGVHWNFVEDNLVFDWRTISQLALEC